MDTRLYSQPRKGTDFFFHSAIALPMKKFLVCQRHCTKEMNCVTTILDIVFGEQYYQQLLDDAKWEEVDGAICCKLD